MTTLVTTHPCRHNWLPPDASDRIRHRVKQSLIRGPAIVHKQVGMFESHMGTQEQVNRGERYLAFHFGVLSAHSTSGSADVCEYCPHLFNTTVPRHSLSQRQEVFVRQEARAQVQLLEAHVASQ